MQNSSIPTRMPVPFANSGVKQTIPIDSQIGIEGGRASFTDGFPPLTRIPLTAGGIPPYGTDFNGVLNAITDSIRWANAGGGYLYDSAFSSLVSGYPKGARLINSTYTGYWLNTTEGNTIAPESGITTGWVPDKNHGVTSITGLAGANVTLTALQASNDRITLSGTLTANINLVFPSWLSKWIVTNNCTGNFTVTCKTASGSGVAIPVGTTAVVFSDGTNITLNGPLMVQAATNNNHAVNLGQGNAQWSPVVGASRNAKMSVTAASATATFTADQLTVTTGLSGQPYLLTSFSKTINLATTGAGGMDTGTVPAAGFVALYAIYNPTTQVSALLAVNATSVLAPEVYGGANMPSGYTASALVSVWRTASSQFTIGYQLDRNVSFPRVTILSVTTGTTPLLAINMPNYLPINAKYCSVDGSAGTSNNGVVGLAFASSLSGIAWRASAMATTASYGVTYTAMNIPITTTQTVYYSANATVGTFTNFASSLVDYSF
ncbi:hypothetical protein [Yersinia massiliensis]|uniref:hypothetical protein n=1 Tax=Yersinia massiliensis TaxID=419257 RepID=UPI0002D266C2|nr:hypothetical protein [Yersinia massiliensis]